MRGLISIAIRGSWKNLKRIILHSERVTSMEMRHRILSGQVKLPETVNHAMCIGCGACSRICPTKAITMEDIEPVKLTEKYTKKTETNPQFSGMLLLFPLSRQLSHIQKV